MDAFDLNYLYERVYSKPEPFWLVEHASNLLVIVFVFKLSGVQIERRLQSFYFLLYFLFSSYLTQQIFQSKILLFFYS